MAAGIALKFRIAEEISSGSGETKMAALWT